jgi:hypothetical protein
MHLVVVLLLSHAAKMQARSGNSVLHYRVRFVKSSIVSIDTSKAAAGANSQIVKGYILEELHST